MYSPVQKSQHGWTLEEVLVVVLGGGGRWLRDDCCEMLVKRNVINYSGDEGYCWSNDAISQRCKININLSIQV